MTVRFRTSGTAWDGQPWVLAPSLVTLAYQIEAIRPLPHGTDGTVAGKAHDQANPTSDHTVWPRSQDGMVYAIDVGESIQSIIDHLWEQIRVSRDPRVMYAIHDKRMFSSYPAHGYDAWQWRPYSGYNAHLTHGHLSVQNWMSTGRLSMVDSMRLANDKRAWAISKPGGTTPTPGDEEMELIKNIQTSLNKAGVTPPLTVDGVWGPKTEANFIAGLKLGPAAAGVSEAKVRQMIEATKLKP